MGVRYIQKCCLNFLCTVVSCADTNIYDKPRISACQCVGQSLSRATHMLKMSVPCVWIVRHTVCVTLAPMGAENDKVLCHSLKKLLPPLSIIDGCRSDEGQGNVVGCSLRFLLSGSRSTFLELSQTLTHSLRSRDDQASLSPSDPPDPAQLLEH